MRLVSSVIMEGLKEAEGKVWSLGSPPILSWPLAPNNAVSVPQLNREEFFLTVNPSYTQEFSGNNTTYTRLTFNVKNFRTGSNFLQNLMVKVRALAVRPAIPPYKIVLKREGEEEESEGEELVIDEMDTKEAAGDEEVKAEDNTTWEEAVTTLSVTRMPTEHSRWQLSEWLHFCPVQLYNGILEYGKLQFACGLVNFYLFLLSSINITQYIPSGFLVLYTFCPPVMHWIRSFAIHDHT